MQSGVMKDTKNWRQRIIDSPLVLGLMFFVLALGPRVTDLAVFVGPDETSWGTRSANFAQALAGGDLAETYQTGHPGVALMWVETVGSWLRYGAQSVGGSADWETAIGARMTMSTLASKRQVVAVVNAALIALGVLLIHRVFGNAVAWVAGLLMAFDPFLLTESRALRTEGLMTGISTLTLLVLLLYVKERRVGQAVLVGVLTGLSLLSKVSSAVLLPVGALVIGGAILSDRTGPNEGRGRTVVLALLGWGLALLVTVVALWPALWVTPLEVARHLFDYIGLRAMEGGGGGRGTFFMGTPVTYQDLGPQFYLVVLLFRAGPLVWPGLVLVTLCFWCADGWSRRTRVSLGIVAFYLVAYLAVIGLSQLKFDRYVVPMLPLLDMVAAVGLVALWQFMARRWSQLKQFGGLAVLVVAILQLALVLPHHPYYYTYWNPLFGGPRQAIRVLPVGVGYEGIEQVTAYLNALPSAERLKLASYNSGKIRPLFKGQTISMTNLDGEWYLADYTFIYISQLQRGKHDPEIIRYLEREPPVFSMTLTGLDYGWLYPGPGAQHFGGDTKLEGRATLHALDLSGTQLSAGETLTVTAYYRNEGQLPSDCFYVRIVDADGYVWAGDEMRPRPGFEGASHRRRAVVEGEAVLMSPPGMPKGQYTLKMGFEDVGTGSAIGEFILPPDVDDITVERSNRLPVPGSVQPLVPLSFVVGNELELLGYDLSAEEIASGDTSWLTLYWQALTDVNRDYVVGVSVLDTRGREVAYWLGRPVYSSQATDQWEAGQIVQDPWRLEMPTDIAPGTYVLQLTLFDSETQAEVARLILEELSVMERRQVFEPPAVQSRVDVNLDDRAGLLGYDLRLQSISHEERLWLTLYWEAVGPMDVSYKVFVHVIGPDGTLLAQHDGSPAGGKIPTDSWVLGEFVTDEHMIGFAAPPPGEYRLLVGMYDSVTGDRLSTAEGDTTILLQTFDIS